MPSPYEMVSGPLVVYTAPEGTAAPAVNVDPPAPWKLLGTNGARSISEDGLSISFEETVEGQRTLGSTGIAKQFRSEEDLSLSCTLLDLSVETFAVAMSGLPVDTHALAATAKDFTATPVPVVSGGSGSGAVIASITVDSNGDITSVTWTSGGTGYAANDILTFTQGSVSGTYTLQSSDLSSGVIDNLSGKTIAGTVSGNYRQVRLLRGFSVLNLAFLARGFSPYGDLKFAQYWIPKAYPSFSGEVQYTKGEAAGIELSIMPIEDNSGTALTDPITGLAIPNPGHGLYMAEE